MRPYRKMISSSLILILTFSLISACSAQAITNDAPEISPTAIEVLATETPAYQTPPETAISVDYDDVSFWFDDVVAKSWSVKFVPQGPGSSTGAGPVDHSDPDYIIFSLDFYAVGDPNAHSLHQPLIYIYPAEEMAQLNPVAAPRIDALHNLLADPSVDLTDQTQALPFLPLINAAQVFHSQVKFLDFQNGQGLRYLTMYSQGPMPIVNAGLIYTYQGLTDDGNYYVAAYLPVNQATLHQYADEAHDLEGDAFMTDPLNYIAGMAEMLDRQASATFSPDLSTLDTIMESLLIRP